MKDLYIVGAGGFGREVLHLLYIIASITGPQWNIKGFLDDTPDPLNGKACDISVVGSIQDYQPAENDTLVMGIANPQDKNNLSKLLIDRGATFETIIHPYVHMGLHNTVGEGSVIPWLGMTVNISIGRFCTLLGPALGHDVSIGDFSTIAAQCNVMGNVAIGKRVFVGGSAVFTPHVSIGDGAYVGAGSVVVKDVQAGVKVFGNPAREIGICE